MKKLALMVLSLCLAGCGGAGNNAVRPTPPGPTANAAPAEDPELARKLFDEAGELSLSGDHSGAAEKLERAVKSSPNDGEIHARLGYSYSKLLRFDDALGEYLRAAELTEGNEQRGMKTQAAYCYYRLGFEARAAGQLEEALEFAKKSVDIALPNRDELLLLADIQKRLERFGDAAATYAQLAGAAVGEQRYADMSELGQAQFFAGQYEGAIDTYTEMIDANVDGFEAYGWRAYSNFQLNRLDDAERDFKVAAGRTRDSAKRAEYEEALQQLAGRK